MNLAVIRRISLNLLRFFSGFKYHAYNNQMQKQLGLMKTKKVFRKLATDSCDAHSVPIVCLLRL